MAMLVLFRAHGAPPFAPEQRQSLETCGRHVTTALRLWYSARTAEAGAQALASSLNAAALLVDAEAHVVWMNARATAWVESARITVIQGRLVEVREVEIDLARAIRGAAEHRCDPPIHTAQGITLEIVPATPAFAAPTDQARALVLLRDRNGCRRAAAALAANYRLTASEVDLAIGLWKGVLIAEYARQRSVAMSTVRSQLKALLAKTGTRRQSDVVALVAQHLPMVSGDVMADPYYCGRDTRANGDTSNG
jgi:DNA-binding CsgD family transcriptional regulator